MIRAAEGGTLFLDEVGDLPLDIQPKLLRFLQEGEIQPLGEHRPMKVDVRVIAATNSNLEEMVAAGRFREDLYHRLGVILIAVPSLSERKEDIALLADKFLKDLSEEYGSKKKLLEAKAEKLLETYPWTGNIRELRNVIERLVIMAGDTIKAEDVKKYL